MSESPYPPKFTQFLTSNGIELSDVEADKLPRFIRINPSCADPNAVIEALEKETGSTCTSVDWMPHAMRFDSLDSSARISRCHAYESGDVYGIDVASAVAVIALGVESKDHVLDLCCAPGGKMSLIADIQGNSDDVVGTVTGVDISREREFLLAKAKAENDGVVENSAKKPIQTKVKPFHETKLIIGDTKARNQKAARSSNRWYTYNSASISKETTPPFQSGQESLTLFGVSSEEMSATRQEEEMVLQAMFGPDFDSITEPNARFLRLDAAIPSEYLSKGVKPKARHFLEIYFGQESVYPYEPPVIVFRDETDRLASRYVLAICAVLHEKAKLWTGSELEEFLSCPPPAYLKLAQEKQRAVSRQTSAVPSKTPQKKALTGGPLPRYNQLYYGVGVAITLKADQGTGRTVNGFIQEVLTAGDHPRGVKVRLRDSRVGRVQFLTGLSFEAGVQTNKSNSSGLPSGFKNLSIKEKSTPPSSPQVIPQKFKASASKNASFITGMGQVTQRSRSPSPVRVRNSVEPKTKTFIANMSKDALDRQSREVQNAFIKQQQSEKYIKMKAQREGLPAFQLQDEIIKTIAKNRVVIVSGETGCGKSTQVPQFILEDAIQSGNGARCKILVTQPRRISALGLSTEFPANALNPLVTLPDTIFALKIE
ncbi:hypothetical protein HDU78_011808 [Chytriomyces hyalinus]|nr:hypothetical protein HDU78_011808 [Chytriomyces hyalinus]